MTSLILAEIIGHENAGDEHRWLAGFLVMLEAYLDSCAYESTEGISLRSAQSYPLRLRECESAWRSLLESPSDRNLRQALELKLREAAEALVAHIKFSGGDPSESVPLAPIARRPGE